MACWFPSEGAGGLEREGLRNWEPRGWGRCSAAWSGSAGALVGPLLRPSLWLPVVSKRLLESENPELQRPRAWATRRPWWDHPAWYCPRTALFTQSLTWESHGTPALVEGGGGGAWGLPGSAQCGPALLPQALSPGSGGAGPSQVELASFALEGPPFGLSTFPVHASVPWTQPLSVAGA